MWTRKSLEQVDMLCTAPSMILAPSLPCLDMASCHSIATHAFTFP